MDPITRIESGLAVVKPAGDGPFPVSIQLHGCGGIQPMQHRYAQAARAAGVAVVLLDSLGPRGIGPGEARLTVCTGLRLRGAERALDLVAAMRWLGDQPWADFDRIAAAGWSHGAWAVMEALAASPTPHAGVFGGLRAAILFYPYAGPPSRTHRLGWGANRPRVYACLAGRDAVVGTVRPTRALARLRNDGLCVNVLSLPDATHAFDEDAPSDPRTRYRDDLAQQAVDFYVEALRESLAVPRASSTRLSVPLAAGLTGFDQG